MQSSALLPVHASRRRRRRAPMPTLISAEGFVPEGSGFSFLLLLSYSNVPPTHLLTHPTPLHPRRSRTTRMKNTLLPSPLRPGVSGLRV